VGFLYLPFEDPALCVEVVAREPLIAALPAEHPLAARSSVRVRDLASELFVLPAQHRMPGLLAQVLDACRRAGFAPAAVQKDVWLMQTVIGLVAAGLGVALVPASVEHLHRTGVAYRPLRDAVPSVELGAVWRRDGASPALERFLAVLRAAS
jgi:DNA-binding transcriptional LysR family regulator